MRKAVVVICSVLVFVFNAAEGFTAYIGDPIQTIGKKKIAVTGESCFVTKRETKDPAGTKATIDESKQLGMKLTYGITDNLDIYGKLGTADYKVKIDLDAGLEFDYQSDIYYGFGVRYLFPLKTSFFIITDIGYIDNSNVGVKSMGYAGETALTSRGGKGDFRNFQASLLAGKEIMLNYTANIIPYAGFCYDRFRYDIGASDFRTTSWSVDTTAGELEGDDSFGVFVGMSVAANEHWSFNVEGRFVAETTIASSVSYRF
ncbi:MAG: hypothetical protein ABH952_08845 [Candidatus Omnitrophota bacterium]